MKLMVFGFCVVASNVIHNVVVVYLVLAMSFADDKSGS